MVPILIVSRVLDCEDVERDHHTIDGQQHRLRPLIHLQDRRLPTTAGEAQSFAQDMM